MFQPAKKRLDSAPAIHTLLGKETLWKGEIHAGGNSLRVEGTVEGTIHSDGEVTVAPSGVVNGTINARHLIVTGRVEGVFRISECLEIHGTGCVEGDVEVGSLVVDEGGTLQGTCTRKGGAKEAARPREDRFSERATLTSKPMAPATPPTDIPFARGYDPTTKTKV